MKINYKFLDIIKKGSNILLIIVVFIGFFSFVSLAETQRSWFGEQMGNKLWHIEIGIFIFIYLGYRLWKKGKIDSLIAFLWIVGAGMLVFWGWFLHPNQVISRAFDRTFYNDIYLISEITEESKKKHLIDKEARQLELKAAEIRSKNSIRNSFDNQWLWILSFLFLCKGILKIVEIKILAVSEINK